MRPLIDVSTLSECACNHGFEILHKAIAEQVDEPLIWRPHENVWLTELCEAVTVQGQARLLATQDALFTALGIQSGPSLLAKGADGWSPSRLADTVARLHKPLEQYDQDDWLMLVDLIINSHLVPSELQAITDSLVWRAQLAGRLDAAQQQFPDLAPHEAVLKLVMQVNPTRHAVPGSWFRRAWEWAKTRVAIHVVQLTDNLRARIAGTIIRHIEVHGTAQRQLLEQGLRDVFGAANRDWRRIAITEAGEAANLTYLQQYPDGTPMERVEVYQGACAFCKKIHGMVLTWSTRPLDESFGWTHIWPGKDNVGRSASPRKMTPEGLVERTESELFWPAAGLQHPHCRGRWLARPKVTLPRGADPDFAAWVDAQLKASRPLV
jgi:hypothetical protein